MINHPERTAIARTQASAPARQIAEHLASALGVITTLDFGTGKSLDVRYYCEHGLQAEGYDENPGYGWPRPASVDFDFVACVYVLNVLDSRADRIQALHDAAGFLRTGGHMLVVTRSVKEIMGKATKRGWPAHNDGYWSDKAEGKFQRGIDRAEILDMAREVGCDAADMSAYRLNPIGGASWALLKKALPPKR
jgi:SAM-dependent methyltransferase